MGFPSIGVAARICSRESLFYQHKIAQPISNQAKYLWNYRSLGSENSWERNNSRAEFLFPKKKQIDAIGWESDLRDRTKPEDRDDFETQR